MTEPVHRRNLARRVAERLGLTTDAADAAVAATFEAIADELAAGRTVIVRGFGTFEARRMQPRVRRKPDTQEEIHIAARVKPAFRSGETLRDRLNQKKE